jgi:DNA polymerase
LRDLITNGASLPGNNFGPLRMAPIGPLNPEVMVISDLPDIWDEHQTDRSTSANSNLLRRMMSAIGIDLSECFCTWLASSTPSTGEVPEQALPELTDFMRHQIKLVRPKSLVILGSTACRALLSEQLMNARAELHNVNHDGRNMAALTTFHPRTLIARPAMKAQAWRDLQMFAKRAAE